MTWIHSCFTDENIPNRTCVYDLPLKGDIPETFHPDTSWNPIIRVRIGLYYVYLSDWFKVFPRNQFYITTLDEYSTERIKVLKQMTAFLELPKFDFNNIKKARRRNSQRKNKLRMFDTTRQILDNFYKPFNVKLAIVLNDESFDF